MQQIFEWVKYSNSKGFNINGRSRRSEFWYNCLFYTIISIALGIVMGVADAILLAISDKLSFIVMIINLALSVVSIGIFLKMLPITVRRLHDTGKSGWMYLVCILANSCCGIGSILLLWFLCQDSTPGDNQYGPNPKGNDNGMNGYNQNMDQYNQGQGGYGQAQGQYNQGQNQYGQGQYNQNQYGQAQGQSTQGLGQYTQNNQNNDNYF